MLALPVTVPLSITGTITGRIPVRKGDLGRKPEQQIGITGASARSLEATGRPSRYTRSEPDRARRRWHRHHVRATLTHSPAHFATFDPVPGLRDTIGTAARCNRRTDLER